MTDLQMLQELFGQALTIHPFSKDDQHEYFETEDGTIFSINKSELTEREAKLLHRMFSPVKTGKPMFEHKLEQMWYSFLFEQGESPLSFDHSVRIFYFSTVKQLDEKLVINELFKGMMNEPVILWEDEQEAIIIEQFPEGTISYEQFLETMDSFTGDFLIEPVLQIGQLHKMSHLLPEKIQHERRMFKLLQNTANKRRVISFYEALPILLFEASGSFSLKAISDTLLELFEDKELVQTMKTYLSCHLNVSLTAKKLFMHRNSLQYRLDKFTEKSGLDFKHFPDAVFTFLIIEFLAQVKR